MAGLKLKPIEHCPTDTRIIHDMARAGFVYIGHISNDKVQLSLPIFLRALKPCVANKKALDSECLRCYYRAIGSLKRPTA